MIKGVSKLNQLFKIIFINNIIYILRISSQAFATNLLCVEKIIIRSFVKTSGFNKNSITIFLRTSNFTEPFYSESATEKLNTSTNDTGILMKTAMKLTEKIFMQNTPFKKAGVIMQDLQTSEYIQLDLLHQISPQSMEKKARLMQTIDQLNNRFGRGSVDWAICSIDSKLEIRREYPNRYSTLKVLELPIVKT